MRSKQISKKRKRGIRASKLKLTQALSQCGLHTQIALAEKIADLEGSDTVPKDMVGRAFRETPIEFASLSRIALALEVEPHSLFMTENESLFSAQRLDTVSTCLENTHQRSAAKHTKLREKLLISYGLFSTAFLISGFLFVLGQPKSIADEGHGQILVNESGKKEFDVNTQASITCMQSGSQNKREAEFGY